MTMSLSTPLLVAQLTDTHLYANEQRTMKGCPTVLSFQTVLEQLSQVQPRPDVLLLTGDLSQDETVGSYEQLRDRLTPLNIPAYWLPGNHDQIPADMDTVLATNLISPQKCFQQGGWNFILLNSMLHQQVQGRLSTQDLEFLERQLEAAPNLPTLVALHHPPVAIASAWMDAIGLENPEDLFGIIARHPQVKIVLFGHIHQAFDQERNGVRYLGSPSTCVQFVPQTEKIAVSSDLPGFRLLKLYPDGTYKTQVERVPFRFNETENWE